MRAAECVLRKPGCARMFCITALDKKIVGRWNAIANFFGAV
jgi:hypothetical protein